MIAQNNHYDLFKCYTHQLTDIFSVFFDTPNDHKTNVFILFKELTNFCFSISQSPIVQLQNATEVTQLYHAGLWDMYIYLIFQKKINKRKISLCIFIRKLRNSLFISINITKRYFFKCWKNNSNNCKSSVTVYSFEVIALYVRCCNKL